MTTMKRRYNAEIQRAKGLLELAAAVYDTSLSFQTTRAAEQVLQTDSRVGYSLKLSLTTRRSQHENGVSLSFAADGFRELRAVAEGKISLAWINPSVAATLAFKNGTIDAVFDEGIKSWGQTAVDRGFRYLPVEGQILKRLTAMGYRRSVVPKSRFQSMDETSTRWISAAGP